MLGRTLRVSAFAATLVLTAAALPALADEAGGTGGAPAPAAQAAEAEWIADFDKAVEVAKAQKKHLLVDFTGSDWCGWCKKLHAEVFAQPEFVSAAPKDFVLVALDFPHAPEIQAKVPNPKRNAELAAKYGIQGYPTIMILSPEGEVVAQTGYKPGGATAYLEHLSTIRTEGLATVEKVRDMQKRFDAAAGDAKLAVAGEALELFTAAKGMGAARGALPIVRAGVAADPKNEKGFAVRGLTLLLKSGADDATIASAIELDPKNEAGLQEIALFAKLRSLSSDEEAQAFVPKVKAFAEAGTFKDPAVYVNLIAATVNIYKMKLNDLESAKAVAQILKDKGPKDNAKLTKFLDSVLGEGASK